MMDKMDIAFPHLGIYLQNVPKSFMIGNFEIALYGVIVASGMLAGIFMAAHIAKMTRQDPDLYWDVSIWIIISSIIGARAYYCIFFWDYYKENPLQIFNLRGGGLAIYGGIIGAILMIFIYAKIKKQNALEIVDTASYGLVLGQIIGRWANFFNREVFGEYTDSLFAMRLPVEMVRSRDISPLIEEHMAEGTNYIQVHPTFLYESLWNCGVLLILFLIMRRRKYHGQIILAYFFLYGAGRAWIEYIRTDQLYIADTKIPVSLVLSLVMMAFSLIVDQIMRARIRKNPSLEVTSWQKTPADKSAETNDADANNVDANNAEAGNSEANDADANSVEAGDSGVNDAETGNSEVNDADVNSVEAGDSGANDADVNSMEAGNSETKNESGRNTEASVEGQSSEPVSGA